MRYMIISRRNIHLHVLLSFLVRLTLVPWFLREIYARRKITIINYHDPTPEVFSSHLEFFTKHYSIISIDELFDAIENESLSLLPPKPLFITLDDGHVGNFQLIDVIKKYKVPLMIYVTAGIVDTKRNFWFKIQGLSGSEISFLKSLPDNERRARLRKKYGHDDRFNYTESQGLNSTQLQAFKKIGVSIGSHTMFHPQLDKCSDVTGVAECYNSKKVLEKIIGQPVIHFAYPGGGFDSRVRSWVHSAGYKTARTIETGWVTDKTSLYRLPNFGISDNAGKSKAVVQACGLWDFCKTILSFFFHI